ncbi:MAG: hypothetical protein ACJ77N_12330 [Chloroflexota bacterium]
MEIRKPFFAAAVVLIAIAVLIEVGDGLVSRVSPAGGATPPGVGIPYLALVDGLVLFTVILMAVGLFVPQNIEGRAQGIVTLVVSLLVLLAAIVLVFLAISLLLLMLALLASFFGIVVYAAVFADFDRSAANAILAFLLLLKLAFAGCIVLAHQRFLENKGLVLLVLSSLLANVIVSLLHGLVPLFLVAITDAIAAIVVAIIGIIWSVFLLVGAVVSIVKIIRLPQLPTQATTR